MSRLANKDISRERYGCMGMITDDGDFKLENNLIRTIIAHVDLITDKLDDVELELQIRGCLDSVY